MEQKNRQRPQTRVPTMDTGKVRSILSSSERSSSRRKKEVTFLLQPQPLRAASVRPTARPSKESRPATRVPAQIPIPLPRSAQLSPQAMRKFVDKSALPHASSPSRRWGENQYEENPAAEEDNSQDEREVKDLEKWEHRSKENLLNFYVFNLTSKIQGKIMSEDKGPSINLRNINFINMADRVCPGSKEQRRPREDSAGNVLNETQSVSRQSAIEREYFEKHLYVMKERMLETFVNSERIPSKEKRMMEAEFHKELGEHRELLRSIKEERSKLFIENNEKHRQIERLNELIQVSDVVFTEGKKEELEQKRDYMERKRRLAVERRDGHSIAVVNFIVLRERMAKQRQERQQQKCDLKADWERNKENIDAFESKIELVKGKIGFIRVLLREYYTNLLRQGTDTRGHGLVWIISQLQGLGVHVTPAMYPAFLSAFQPEAHEFTLELARKDEELGKIQRGQESLRKRYDAPTISKADVFGFIQENYEKSLRTVTRNGEARSGPGSAAVYTSVRSASILRNGSRRSSVSSEECLVRPEESLLRAMGSEVYRRLPECERTMMGKKLEIETLKREYAGRLGKVMSKLPQSTQKLLLSRVVAALLGESAYEIEVVKSIQSKQAFSE